MMKSQQNKLEQELEEKMSSQNKAFKKQVDVLQRQIDNLYEKAEKKE